MGLVRVTSVALLLPCCLLAHVAAAFSLTFLSPSVAKMGSHRGSRQGLWRPMIKNANQGGRRRLVVLQESNDDETGPDYETEETLLKLHLGRRQPGASTDHIKDSVINYCQSFPFAAVLPVQPLQYLPAYDKDGVPDGVELKFLRKKTDLKSGIDGGIRFFVSPDQDGGGLDVTAKRNSLGQTIRKIHAERLVVTAFVAGITGDETEKYGQAPLEVVQVTSLFHKWM